MEPDVHNTWRVVGVTSGGAPQPKLRQLQRKKTMQVSPMMAKIIKMEQLLNPRRQHRICHVKEHPSQRIIGCINVQQCNWASPMYRPMLYNIIEHMRAKKIDVMMVSDVGAPSWVQHCIHYIAIEEYIWIVFEKVAIILSRPMVAAWRQAGEEVATDSESDRWLGANIMLGQCRVQLVATYVPTQSGTRSNHARHMHFEAGSRLRAQRGAPELCIIGGDFNSHIGRATKGEDRPMSIGSYGSITPTTGKAHHVTKWIAEEGLTHISSHIPAMKRGTWWHPVSKAWYEQEIVVSNIPYAPGRWQSLRTFTVDGADHKANYLALQIPTTSKTNFHKTAAKGYIQSGFGGQRPTMPILWDTTKGNSQHAEEKRKDYKKQQRQPWICSPHPTTLQVKQHLSLGNSLHP